MEEDTADINQGEEEAPAEIMFDSPVVGIDFHPKYDYIGVGVASGETFIYQYSPKGNTLLYTSNHHRGSCRTVAFSRDGLYLFTGSEDASLGVLDVTSGKLIFNLPDAHNSGVNALAVRKEMGDLLVSGDDDGVIKVWDLRKKGVAFEWHEHTDFISDLLLCEENNILLATGGDGCLSSFNFKKGNLVTSSETLEEDLLSVAFLKQGKRVITGSTEGNLYIWNYNDLSVPVGNFRGHPKSVDTLVPLSEDMLCTGSSDGIIRVVTIEPSQFLGVIGDHTDFPIERLRLSRENSLLASCSHDNSVKFWDIRYIFEDEEDDKEAMETETNSVSKSESMEPDEELSSKKKRKGFWDDL